MSTKVTETMQGDTTGDRWSDIASGCLNLLGRIDHRPTVITMLIIDCSTSMRRHMETVRRELAELIRTLAADTNNRHLISIITFNGHIAIDIGLAEAGSVRERRTLNVGGGSRIHDATCGSSHMLLQFVYCIQNISREHPVRAHLHLFTDGDDRGSRQGTLLALPSQCAQMRRIGVHLSAHGFGIDTEALARQMGFPEETATSRDKDDHNIGLAFTDVTQSSTKRF